MPIYFHSCLCSYLSRVPILVEDTVYIYIYIYVCVCVCVCVYVYMYVYIYIYIYIYIVTFHCHPKFTHQPNLYLHHLLYKAFQWCCRPTHFMTCFPELFFNICTLGPSIQQCCNGYRTHPKPLSHSHSTIPSFTDRMQRALQCLSPSFLTFIHALTAELLWPHPSHSLWILDC